MRADPGPGPWRSGGGTVRAPEGGTSGPIDPVNALRTGLAVPVRAPDRFDRITGTGLPSLPPWAHGGAGIPLLEGVTNHPALDHAL